MPRSATVNVGTPAPGGYVVRTDLDGRSRLDAEIVVGGRLVIPVGSDPRCQELIRVRPVDLSQIRRDRRRHALV